MNLLLRLYLFLGSLSFTLILFSFIILVVCIGTFLESLTESHRFAEQWTYGHPLFFIVFLSLFANILFSATRRWPFQKRHIPFLITHLGLLLLLTGVWIKGAFGLQGHMNLLEGSGSHHVILPNQQRILLTNRQGITQEWHVADTLFGTKARLLSPQHTGQNQAEQAREEQIELVYEAIRQGLQLSVLQGAYLAQCIPYSTEIPYHVRLRDTRKIVYPDSDQAASYEAECLITDRLTGEEEEVRLSMNRVHETADGHRFYLSSISPSHEESVRQVRIVVNRDPLRSLLTYLGAFLVAIGILLLMRVLNKRKA